MATIVATSWPAWKSAGPNEAQVDRQDEDVHDKADEADQREQDEADRQQAAGRVVDDEAEKVEADQGGELRFARRPLAEPVGNLDDAEPPARPTGPHRPGS